MRTHTKHTHTCTHTHAGTHMHAHTCSFLWLEKVLRNEWPAHTFALHLLARQPQSLPSWAQAGPTWQHPGE